MLVVGALRIAGDGGDGREDDAPLRTEVARRSLTAGLTRTYGGMRALLHRRDLGCALRALRRGALELDDPDVGSARSGRRREGEPRRLKLVDQEAGARARGWPRRERGRGRASPLHRAIRAICDARVEVCGRAEKCGASTKVREKEATEVSEKRRFRALASFWPNRAISFARKIRGPARDVITTTPTTK